jgi:hypothetical protein
MITRKWDLVVQALAVLSIGYRLGQARAIPKYNYEVPSSTPNPIPSYEGKILCISRALFFLQ